MVQFCVFACIAIYFLVFSGRAHALRAIYFGAFKLSTQSCVRGILEIIGGKVFSYGNATDPAVLLSDETITHRYCEPKSTV